MDSQCNSAERLWNTNTQADLALAHVEKKHNQKCEGATVC